MRAMVPRLFWSASGTNGAISPPSMATAMLTSMFGWSYELVALQRGVEVRELAQRQRRRLDDQVVEGDLGRVVRRPGR